MDKTLLTSNIFLTDFLFVADAVVLNEFVEFFYGKFFI